MVIIVFGLPGSGKSYFATRLAELIGATYLNSDRIRKALFANRTYSDREKSAVYDEMLARTRELLQQNRNVVMDATFHKSSARQKFVEELGGNDLFFIEVWAEEPVARKRVQQPRPWSEAGLDVHAMIKSQWEPMPEPHLLLQSTDDNINEMLQLASDWLAEP